MFAAIHTASDLYTSNNPNMIKKALLVLALAAGISAEMNAQSTAVAAPQNTAMDEVRTMSGQLKDVHGRLSQVVAVLNKEIAGTEGGATETQNKRLSDLKVSLSEVEASLTAVNRAPKEQWADTKKQADAVIAKANKTIESIKAQ